MKWSNPDKEVAPTPYSSFFLGIEKKTFGSPSTKVANFTNYSTVLQGWDWH